MSVVVMYFVKRCLPWCVCDSDSFRFHIGCFILLQSWLQFGSRVYDFPVFRSTPRSMFPVPFEWIHSLSVGYFGRTLAQLFSGPCRAQFASKSPANSSVGVGCCANVFIMAFNLFWVHLICVFIYQLLYYVSEFHTSAQWSAFRSRFTPGFLQVVDH